MRAPLPSGPSSSPGVGITGGLPAVPKLAVVGSQVPVRHPKFVPAVVVEVPTHAADLGGGEGGGQVPWGDDKATGRGWILGWG